jgi:tetratricopeptide (TPR) repeat protein
MGGKKIILINEIWRMDMDRDTEEIVRHAEADLKGGNTSLAVMGFIDAWDRLFMTGKPEEYLALARKLCGIEPDSADYLMRLAISFYMAGEVEESGAVCEKIIAADPKNREAWHYLTMLCEWGDWPALGICKRALEADPGMTDERITMGKIYLKHRRLEKALETFEGVGRDAVSLLGSEAAYASAQQYMGLALYESGRFGDAAACFRKAWETKPGILSVTGELTNRFTGAYEQVLEGEPGAIEILFDLAIVYRNEGRDNERALEIFHRIAEDPRAAVLTMPPHGETYRVEALREIAALCEAMGNVREAAEARSLLPAD